MKRNVQGKFALKNEEIRSVRSLRLTDFTWEALGVAAESLGITRADWLEQIVRDNNYILPSNTRFKPASSSSNTRREDEIERLKAEVRRLNEENALLVERMTVVLPQGSQLQALCSRVLSSLKLGKQAPSYKVAQKALERFISELSHPA